MFKNNYFFFKCTYQNKYKSQAVTAPNCPKASPKLHTKANPTPKESSISTKP